MYASIQHLYKSIKPQLPKGGEDYFLLTRSFPEEIARFEEAIETKDDFNLILIHDFMMIMDYLFLNFSKKKFKFIFLNEPQRDQFLSWFPKLSNQTQVLTLQTAAGSKSTKLSKKLWSVFQGTNLIYLPLLLRTVCELQNQGKNISLTAYCDLDSFDQYKSEKNGSTEFSYQGEKLKATVSELLERPWKLKPQIKTVHDLSKSESGTYIDLSCINKGDTFNTAAAYSILGGKYVIGVNPVVRVKGGTKNFYSVPAHLVNQASSAGTNYYRHQDGLAYALAKHIEPVFRGNL